MAEIDSSYQAKVGREQGGERFYMKEDGEFKFFDTDWTGKALRNFLGSFFTVPTVLIDSGTTIGGPLNLSLHYGTYHIIASTKMSLMSCNLPSAWVGAQLVLNGSGVEGDGNIIADASWVAGSMLGVDGTSLSSLNLSAVFYAVLACATENIWQVMEASASVTEQAAA